MKKRKNPNEIDNLIDKNITIFLKNNYAQGVFKGILKYSINKSLISKPKYYFLTEGLGKEFDPLSYNSGYIVFNSTFIKKIINNDIFLKFEPKEKILSAKKIFNTIKILKNRENNWIRLLSGYSKTNIKAYAINIIGEVKYNKNENNFHIQNYYSEDFSYNILFRKESIINSEYLDRELFINL